MKKYGIPYKGSKDKIAEEILENLPSGKRLVDLFGGGFAITHCALEKYSDKYENFMYNDINPLLPPLIEKAISGYYSSDDFLNTFVTRNDFYSLKEKDGYIKWIWSFANNGNDYMYGKNIEELKHKAHDLIVFDKTCAEFKDITLTEKELHSRRLEFLKKQSIACRIWNACST